MEKILEHFRKNDSLLYGYFQKFPQIKPVIPDKPANYFRRLCEIIIGQQLSGKAAAVIIGRFTKLFVGGKAVPGKTSILKQEKLRSTGMSNSKARYIKNLAEYFLVNEAIVNRLDDLTDDKLITELTKVKGIGPWTAEMFLIFVLGREDVFSFGDNGLKRAIIKIYGFNREPDNKSVEKIIGRWSPYKSYACRVLWLSLE